MRECEVRIGITVPEEITVGELLAKIEDNVNSDAVFDSVNCDNKSLTFEFVYKETE